MNGSRLRASTFPEALVTMVLLVMFAVVVGAVFFQGQTLALRLDHRERALQEKLSLLTELPMLCQAVQPPEWIAADHAFGISTGGLSVRYWDADPKKALNLEVANGVLSATYPGGSRSWKALDSVSVAYWKSSGRVIGLVVTWKEGSEVRTVSIPWGARPL